MPITVAELIKELKKHPMSSFVGVSHHDNSEDEISACVKYVCSFDPEESDDPQGNRNIMVVLNC